MLKIPRESLKSFGKYGISLLSVLIAVGLIRFVFPLMEGTAYFLFLTAIIVSTIYGGLISGLVATTFSASICFYLFHLSTRSNDWMLGFVIWLLFCITAVFIVLLYYSQIQAQQAQKKAEEKYRMIFEDAITGIYETTIDGCYVTANPKLAMTFGYQTAEQMIAEMTDLNARFYVKPDRRKEFIKEVSKTGNIYGFESQIYCRDGSVIWIQENSVAVRNNNEEIVGFQGTTIEITDRKETEQKLLKVYEDLERKVQERTSELLHTNQALEKSQKQLRDLTAYLQSVREEERKHLARELHDELGQSLTALKIDLSWLTDKLSAVKTLAVSPEILEKLKLMLSIVDMTMETTRKIVAELRPATLDELGLEAAIEWQTGSFQERTGIPCEVELEFNEDQLNQNLKTTIFRILQECLTNVARHSKATKVHVMMKDEGEFLSIQIDDNGRGISDEELAAPRSLGIVGMRERALMHGGEFAISRNQPDGTLVSITLPHHKENL